MERSKIMTKKSAVLLAIALTVGLISSGLHAAKKQQNAIIEKTVIAAQADGMKL